MSFLDDIKKQFTDVYRGRAFPMVVLIGGCLLGAFLQQWVVLAGAVGAFFYFQFFKKDR